MGATNEAGDRIRSLGEVMEIAADAATELLNEELQVMRTMARTLEKLDEAAQYRVMSWLNSRLPRRGLL